MQEHRRQAAAAAAEKKAAHRRSTAAGPFSAGSSRQEAAKERERKAAAAAAESARILQEEQAKDADWSAAMMKQARLRWRRCEFAVAVVLLYCGLPGTGKGGGDCHPLAALAAIR